jgi:hypothetical protein
MCSFKIAPVQFAEQMIPLYQIDKGDSCKLKIVRGILFLDCGCQ